MNEQEDQQSLQLSNKIITRNHEIPTLTISPQRFHYLYSAVMPQIHLTLVSVLQGIAFGVLLLGIPFPTSFESLFQLYFYFPYLISGIIGYVGPQGTDVTSILLEGLSKLEYRGYDSAGIAVLRCAAGLRIQAPSRS